ncbi:HCLS1-binding protein 3 [Parasteatoda tepidariorum]|uniref:HCLS1-binding protein 3 n=1 Tax=Parasteatoda tepidariorum TaxID=114398 RepID=UPI001C71F114|nr:HCLS1-binding protein 3 [Parasteatoda tepidariorum]
MSTPLTTKRQLKNTNTGIDISVPGFQEESAPLGGVSILYEISVLTTLELFKTSLHSEEDVVHFSIFKAYREINDLQNKLSKKFPKADLPPLPTADKLSCDQKVETLDTFMQSVAKNVDLCSSSTFVQFIGLNSSKQHNVSKIGSAATPSESEVFPKMKFGEKSQTSSSSLFEQMKIPGESSNSKNIKTAPQSLFDEFDDDSLFSSKSYQKKKEQSNETEKKTEKKAVSNKQKSVKSDSEKVVESDIIIQDRKFGDVSLFDEQDFGDYITKDEEALFLVTPSDEKKKNNTLITRPNDTFLSAEEIEDSKENLDDLLDLSPLPIVPPPSEVKIESSEPTISSKPVPLPRKKSLGKIEMTENKKPEVLPRKVFLNKNENVSKPKPPVTSPKPSVGGMKPKPPLKPKPPPKTSKRSETGSADLDSENANKAESIDNSSSSITDGLKELDIIKYIEQEEKSLVSNLSLFD